MKSLMASYKEVLDRKPFSKAHMELSAAIASHPK
jgi:hypothetical protein